MADYLKLTVDSLGNICSRVTSEDSNIHLDQNLCLELVGFLEQLLPDIADQLSTETPNEISRHHPEMFKELYRIAHKAYVLVEKCFEEEWWRRLFMQACTSHSEEALDVIDDLQWCVAEIRKIAGLSNQASQILHHFKESFKECEELDRPQLLKKLSNHLLMQLPLTDSQLSRFLLERVRVQVYPSTPSKIEASLDYRGFNLRGSNDCSESSPQVCLGAGSSGTVKVTDFLTIQCARKEQRADSEVQLREFAKQAIKLSKLSHPHVVKLYGFYTEKLPDQGYKGCFLMELMSGSLYDMKDQRLMTGRADVKKYPFQHGVAVDVMIQIAKGVRYLHENDVAHRDLKCDNILVCSPSLPCALVDTDYKDCLNVKITDFDQAKFLTRNSSGAHLQSKSNVGTTPWRAPEAYTELGKGSVVKVNPKRIDSYSFAMTCFELLSVEETPFDAMPEKGFSNKKRAILAGQRPPIPEGCPELLGKLIEDCWHAEPHRRPAFDEICRRLQDVRSVQLTGTLSRCNRLADVVLVNQLSDVGPRVMSSFKNCFQQVSPFNMVTRAWRAIMPKKQAPFMHSAITGTLPHVTKDDLFPKEEHTNLIAPKVVVGLDFGTTHSGVAYAKVSNPDEIHTISNWPPVGEEVCHSKTLTAICKSSSQDGDWVWGYPARQEYASRHNRRDVEHIEYFRGLKQSLTDNDISSADHQAVVEYLRKLGNFVLGYLQLYEYEQEPLIMDDLRWCITVPCNWSGDSIKRLQTCLVKAGLVRGQADDGSDSSTFDIFLESDAAARYCCDYFSRAKGDRICVLDIGSGNVQFFLGDCDKAEPAQIIYAAIPSSAESLVEENFLAFISEKVGYSWSEEFWNDHPSYSIALLNDLESLKAGHSRPITITWKHLNSILPNKCSNEVCLSSLDLEFIFKPLVNRVISFLREQFQKTKPNVKRLYVVGGYAKHVYLMEEIKKSFPDFDICMPRSPASAVCEGAVALGLMHLQYSQFQARTQQDGSSSPEGGGQESNFDGGARDADMNGRGQRGSSQQFNPRIPGSSNTSDSKGKNRVRDEDPMDVDALPEKMLVALDFGTSQMGFAYSCASRPSEIIVCEDHQRRTTDLYYERQGDALRLRSCGQKAKDDCRDVPAMGEYVSKPKLHVVVDNVEPTPELHFPAGLIIDNVILDCLREYGLFILEQLQEKFGKRFELHQIQWCLLVPSFWGENAKFQMKACMINGGLLRGGSNVDGSPYPLVTVLEAEAASIACAHSLSVRKGFKFLVASIGGGTLDMVVQEWMGETNEMLDMEEASMGAGGLYGSSCLDLNFLTLLSTKMGPWMSEFLKHNPDVLNDLMSQWEQIKVGFPDVCEANEGYTLHLPMLLQNAWRDFEQSQFEESYESLQLTSDDLMMVFEPVVRTILELIAAQLTRTINIDALVLVGGFSRSSYLSGHIDYRFRDQVKTLVRLADSESAVLRGAVLFALHPKAIRSRIVRKTCGLGMNMDFQAGLHTADEEFNEVERFRIDVEKGSRVEVDYCVSSVHEPLNCGQKNMRFSLHSSVELYPRYTNEESVTKEWDFVVDISDCVTLEEKPQIMILLYYGRSAIEVEAKAVNFGDGSLLPVSFAVETMSERNASMTSIANVAKKTYGIGVCKAFPEKWDLPEYVKRIDSEDLCAFRFATYIQKGTRLDYFASKTLFPIKCKQEVLPFKLYSSLETSPVYVTEDVVVEEGVLEVDIRKGLYLDMDRKVSVRMWFSRSDIKISCVSLNFAKPEDRNLPIRLKNGNWESQVRLNLPRHLRVVPVQSGSRGMLQQDCRVPVVHMKKNRDLMFGEGRGKKKCAEVYLPEPKRKREESEEWKEEVQLERWKFKLEEREMDGDAVLKLCDASISLKAILLDLSGSEKLKKLPDEIGELRGLKYMNLENCSALETLPASIGKLSFLSNLDLSGCEKLKKLPDEIGELRRLKYMNLENCSALETLSASIGKLSFLSHLKLFGCEHLKKLPDEIGELRGLVDMNLGNCSALETLPASIGKLSFLSHLELSGCEHLKKLPDEIDELRGLKYMNLRNCSALETLPASIGKLSFLSHLELSGCEHLKKLPDEIGELRGLKYMILGNCSALETLPASIGKLSDLWNVDLSGCEKLKELPDEIGELRGLVGMNLENCSALETLPASFGKLSFLSHLELSGCEHLKKLPDEIGELRGLVDMNLGNCSALETLPASIGKLSFLSNLDLFGCEKLKKLPDEIGELRGLVDMNLGNCSALETLPASIGKLSFLSHLELSGCEHLKKLPDEIGELRGLKYMNLRNCSALETLPASIGKLSDLWNVDLSGCEKLKELPDEIGELRGLKYMILGNCSCFGDSANIHWQVI